MKPALRTIDYHQPLDATGAEAPQRIPITGTAGAAIYAALKGMAMHPGEMTLTIKKERVAQGGYIYLTGIQKPQPPASR